MVSCNVDTRHPLCLFGFATQWAMVSLLLAGCQQDSPVPTEPRQSAPVQVSVRQVQDFIRRLDTAIDERSLPRFLNTVSKEAFFRVVFAPFEISQTQQRALESQINQSGNFRSVAQVIFGVLENGGDYQCVGSKTENGKTFVLYRLVIPNRPEVHYYQYCLETDKNDRVKANDIRFLLTGVTLSSSVQREVMRSLSRAGELPNPTLESETILEQANAAEPPNEDVGYRKMLMLVTKNELRQAWDFYRWLSEEIRQKKETQFLRVRVAATLGKVEYQEAVVEMRERFPNVLTTDFRAVQQFTAFDQFDLALDAVDRLQAAIGDPFLECLRVPALIGQQRLDEAKSILSKLLAEWPNSARLLRQAVEVELLRDDWPAALTHIQKLHEMGLISLAKIEDLPRYAGLANSPEYKEWRNQLSGERVLQDGRER